MQYARIWTDTEGESHVEWADIDLEPMAGYAVGLPAIGVSAERPATNVHFLQLDPGFAADWHPAPRRQLLIQLSGTVESELRNCDEISGALAESAPDSKATPVIS